MVVTGDKLFIIFQMMNTHSTTTTTTTTEPSFSGIDASEKLAVMMEIKDDIEVVYSQRYGEFRSI